MTDELQHVGTPRHSGRYPYGSGDDGNQRHTTFLKAISDLKKQGLSEVEIAAGMGMKTSELRRQNAIAKAAQRQADATQVARLKEKGYSNVAIGARMGINESSVRSLLDPVLQDRNNVISTVGTMLKNSVDEKGFIDVGAGVENHLGVSRTKLNTALAAIKEDGYEVHYSEVKQLGTGKATSLKILAGPGVTNKEVYQAVKDDKIQMPMDHSSDGGRTIDPVLPINHISSSRVKVRYAEEGGVSKDGVIELRRGVEDLSLGEAKYAQVRIGIDGSHYLKGMAMYGDDMPKGVDIMFNTNKHTGTPMMSSDKKAEQVLKPVKDDDPTNPFGSAIRQKLYTDSKGQEQRSGLNVVNEEGAWSEWSRNISSQVLSKQIPGTAKKQLGLAFDLKQEEFDDLNSLTNPAIKKRLLESFADDCDSSAVHLKAAALPRQAQHVILPLTTINEREIYAPNYQNGESVVLIRHPHGGTFEIPELIVNNNNPEANRIMKGAKDAVGIHPKVASKLSGADFDGDTVLVIPNKDKNIRTSDSIKGLSDFDSKAAYPGYEGMSKMSPRTKQMQMGNISNLITDMTIKGATIDELARAVKHSMVVIDAEKHNLNYKQSAIDNNIAGLKLKYQGGVRSGSSTLISRASSDIRVKHRKDQVKVDPLTGEKVYTDTNQSYTVKIADKKGRYNIDPQSGKKVYLDFKEKIVPRTTKSTKMAEATDAFDLSSGMPIEKIYATHANNLKALANKARKTALETSTTNYSPSASKLYAPEVTSLKAALDLAFRNKPLERKAQLLANKVVAMKKQANPDMDPDDLKKLKGRELITARIRTGAHKQQIKITDREWEAIQTGAVHNSVLNQILLNTDLDSLKQRAMPRTPKGMSASKITRARSMLSDGYTKAEVANALGVSTDTVSNAVA